MKKIMFNDKYGLTQAVLEGRKTQTRRTFLKHGEENLLRRTFLKPGEETLLHGVTPEYLIIAKSRYKLGETVAIAQSYKDIHAEILREVGDLDLKNEFLQSKGYTNKMFVRAEKMPHAIRITNIRVERLQDISDEDCLKEGIWHDENVGLEGTTYWYHGLVNSSFRTPQEAYASLIDSISGKGTWASNPYVFVYDFELID